MAVTTFAVLLQIVIGRLAQAFSSLRVPAHCGHADQIQLRAAQNERDRKRVVHVTANVGIEQNGDFRLRRCQGDDCTVQKRCGEKK